MLMLVEETISFLPRCFPIREQSEEVWSKRRLKRQWACHVVLTARLCRSLRGGCALALLKPVGTRHATRGPVLLAPQLGGGGAKRRARVGAPREVRGVEACCCRMADRRGVVRATRSARRCRWRGAARRSTRLLPTATLLRGERGARVGDEARRRLHADRAAREHRAGVAHRGGAAVHGGEPVELLRLRLLLRLARSEPLV
mmetsp:Transcript_21467/g.53578  ORF Transcript_21467/g.53578 Transcript_21467/m.53578 type:complete len:201 (+) Transcript_21467:185-787(+)